MSNSVKIWLDNYDGVCYPGQTLCGKVECVFNEEKSIRAIEIRFRGLSKTIWTKTQGKSNIKHWAEEVYFDQEFELLAGDDLTVPAGKHSYPFLYILPPQLPASFEGIYGKIRYSITAIVDRPWKIDYKNKLILKVISPLNLNYLPGLCEPIGLSVNTDICCVWCKSGPINLNVSLPFTGYVSGQKLNIAVHVQNMSNVNVDGVQFMLFQDIKCISHQPKQLIKEDERLIKQWPVETAVGAHAQKSWIRSLIVPKDIDFPNVLPCRIIIISYRLMAKVVLPFIYPDLNTACTITIGTVPLEVGLTVPEPPLSELHIGMDHTKANERSASGEGTSLLPVLNAVSFSGGNAASSRSKTYSPGGDM